MRCSLLWDHLITTMSWHQSSYSVDQGTNLLREMFGSINKPTGPLPCRKLLSRLRIASQTDDIGVVWRQWSTTFLEAMKLSIPHKFVSTKSSTLWVDRHIRQEISRHEQFYRMFKCSSKQDWLVKYKYLRNKVTNMISSAKKAYFETLAGTTTNTRKFWSIVRSI